MFTFNLRLKTSFVVLVILYTWNPSAFLWKATVLWQLFDKYHTLHFYISHFALKLPFWEPKVFFTHKPNSYAPHCPFPLCDIFFILHPSFTFSFFVLLCKVLLWFAYYTPHFPWKPWAFCRSSHCITFLFFLILVLLKTLTLEQPLWFLAHNTLLLTRNKAKILIILCTERWVFLVLGVILTHFKHYSAHCTDNWSQFFNFKTWYLSFSHRPLFSPLLLPQNVSLDGGNRGSIFITVLPENHCSSLLSVRPL